MLSRNQKLHEMKTQETNSFSWTTTAFIVLLVATLSSVIMLFTQVYDLKNETAFGTSGQYLNKPSKEKSSKTEAKTFIFPNLFSGIH